MSLYTAGDTITLWATLYEFGTALTGKATDLAFTRARYALTDGSLHTTAPGAWVEDGSGLYYAQITSAPAGAYALIATYTESGHITQPFTWDFEVQTTTQSDSAAAAGMTQARAAKLDSLGAAGVTFLPGPVEVNGVRTIYKRTDYKDIDARSLNWTTADDATWPNLTGATIAFVARPVGGDATLGITVAGVVVTPTGAKQVRVEIPHAATTFTKPGSQSYQLRATLSNGDVIPLATGELRVTDYLGG